MRVEGHLYVSEDGAVGLEVTSGAILSKALRLPPVEEAALTRFGARRELELIASARCRERLATRAAALAAIREWMDAHGCIEVDTPHLQPVPGGALARPFVTHHNALDMETSLRISAELYLRRCTVGDLERVYDLGRRFRNEGMSRRHSPEFTMLEWLVAYSDHEYAAKFTEGLVAHVANRALGGSLISVNETIVDLTPPWRRITLHDAIRDATGLDMFEASRDELLEAASLEPSCDVSWAEAVEKLYGSVVEPTLIEPTLVLYFPVELRPCVKQHSRTPRLGESFDVVLGGMEIGSGGTAIDDPDEQWARFEEQRRRKGAGDTPHPSDVDYVTTLQFGAPPAAGSGIGVERMLMVLLGVDSIRDVMPFSTSDGKGPGG
ncbi:MAG TPA: amino acid--tRNA ligase-related protein [Solirubrobacteraceae bacterium]|nr:amino acid--tRNA ligase-related protein [Solirubrobacteraceae bacterium]